MKNVFTSLALIVCIGLYGQPNCSSSGNTIVFANYDGGVLNIDVDVNISNLKIGVCTYEPVIINLTGTYASNVTQLIRAGFPNTSHNHCGLGVFSTAINGPVPGNYSIVNIPPVGVQNPNGYNSGIICAYTCNTTSNQGGCNTMDQVLDYFQTQFGGTLYSVNAQYCCWKTATTYHVSQLNNSCCISTTPSATISYSGTPYCKSVSNAQSVTLTGDGGGSYSASPAGLSIDPGTGAVNPSLSSIGTYTVTYTVPGCPDFTTTTQVGITASPTATISYPASSFCTGAAAQSVSIAGNTGGVFSSADGLSIDTVTGTISPSQSAAGTYTVTYHLDSIPGCAAFNTTAVVDISAAVNYSFTHSICSGQTYTFANQTVDTTGTYTDTTLTAGGCDSVTELHLTVLPLPSVTLSPDSVKFCPGDSAQICANGNGTYLWSTGQTGSCIYATQGGNYYLTVTDANNCTALSSPVAAITLQLPAVSVSVSGDTLSAFNAAQYQWYLDSNPILNATDSVYVATVDGSYQVMVTDSNGCSSFSNTIPVIHNALIEVATAVWNVFPNPLQQGQWKVECNEPAKNTRIQLYNVTGEKLLETKMSGLSILLNTETLPGVYYLHIQSGEKTIVKKLIRL